MIAYLPWKSDILWPTFKKRKDDLSLFTIIISIQVSSWSATNLQTILFATSITDIIELQNVKNDIDLLSETILGFTKEEEIYKLSTKTD